MSKSNLMSPPSKTLGYMCPECGEFFGDDSAAFFLHLEKSTACRRTASTALAMSVTTPAADALAAWRTIDARL